MERIFDNFTDRELLTKMLILNTDPETIPDLTIKKDYLIYLKIISNMIKNNYANYKYLLTQEEIDYIEEFRVTKLGTILGIKKKTNYDLVDVDITNDDILYIKELSLNHRKTYTSVKFIMNSMISSNYLNNIYSTKYIDLQLLLSKINDFVCVIFLENEYNVKLLNYFLPDLILKRFNGINYNEQELYYLKNINYTDYDEKSFDTIKKICLFQIDLINVLNKLYHGIIYNTEYKSDIFKGNDIDLLNMIYLVNDGKISIKSMVYPKVKNPLINSKNNINTYNDEIINKNIVEKEIISNYITISINKIQTTSKCDIGVPIAFNNCFSEYSYEFIDKDVYIQYKKVINTNDYINIYLDRQTYNITNVNGNYISKPINSDLEMIKFNYTIVTNEILQTFIYNKYLLRSFVYNVNNITGHYIIQPDQPDLNNLIEYDVIKPTLHKIPIISKLNYKNLSDSVRNNDMVKNIVSMFRLDIIEKHNNSYDLDELEKLSTSLTGTKNKDELILLEYINFITESVPNYFPIKKFKVYNSSIDNYSKNASMFDSFYLYEFIELNYISYPGTTHKYIDIDYTNKINTFVNNINKHSTFFILKKMK